MKLTLLLFLSISTVAFASNRKSIMKYDFKSDTTDTSVPSGKCLIVGKVKTGGLPLPDGVVSTIKHKFSGVTDAEGNYKLLIPVQKVQLYFFKPFYGEIVTHEYHFKSGHKVELDFFAYEDIEILEVDKPVIYMYSSTPIKTKISMNLVGDLTFTYPHYTDNWNMIVDRSGTLTEVSSGKKYPYLFWEGETTGLTFQSSKTNFKGYQINTDSTIQFLESRCKEFGFNIVETTDFITFWGPRITRNSFAKIEFLVDEQFNVISQLTVVPQPDNVRRVYILFQGQQRFDSSLYCTPLKIMPLSREGFTLLEWGGTEFPTLKQNVN